MEALEAILSRSIVPMFRHMEDKQPVTNTSGRLRWRDISGPLFRKYVALFLAVVCVALVTNVAFQVWFSYAEHKTALIRIQREQAEAAATKIGQFIKEIESQLGWTTQLPWSPNTLEQRRFDALRLLRQVPAITELAQLDATGKNDCACRGSPWTWWRAALTFPTTPNSLRR